MKQGIDLEKISPVKKIVVHDFVVKYGDWLFKQPVILSLKNAGYTIYQSRNNLFPPVDTDGKKVNYTQSALALVV